MNENRGDNSTYGVGSGIFRGRVRVFEYMSTILGLATAEFAAEKSVRSSICHFDCKTIILESPIGQMSV